MLTRSDSSGSDQTLQKYRDEAKKADVKNPDNVNGGVVHDKPSSSTTSASASASATTTSAAHIHSVAGVSSIGLLAAVAGVLMLL